MTTVHLGGIGSDCEVCREVSASPCEDCGTSVKVTIEKFETGATATISCPNCGEHYDTNLEEGVDY